MLRQRLSETTLLCLQNTPSRGKRREKPTCPFGPTAPFSDRTLARAVPFFGPSSCSEHSVFSDHSGYRTMPSDGSVCRIVPLSRPFRESDCSAFRIVLWFRCSDAQVETSGLTFPRATVPTNYTTYHMPKTCSTPPLVYQSSKQQLVTEQQTTPPLPPPFNPRGPRPTLLSPFRTAHPSTRSNLIYFVIVAGFGQTSQRARLRQTTPTTTTPHFRPF